MGRLLPIWPKLLLLLLTCYLSGCASAWSRAGHELIAHERVYALTNAHLIPIGEPGIRAEQTLIVSQGRIVAMGPASDIRIPAGAELLDMRGKYILPGFVDMHVHLADERDLLRLLSHGVTTVRNMAANPGWATLMGSADARELRRRVRTGELPGPDIYACGPILEGEPPQNAMVSVIRTPAEAEAAVAATAAGGYDCVKVYNHLGKPEFAAVVAAAERHGLPVMGHVPYAVGLDGALAAGMRTIEHLNPYVDNFASSYRFDAAELPLKARQTAAAGVYNCPTLVVWDQHPPYAEAEIAKMPLDPRYRYLPWGLRQVWQLSIPGLYELSYPDKPGYPAHQMLLSAPMVKLLHEQGAPLLIGTDANLTGVYPGDATLREMELFAEAGLPNAAILRAATLTAAEALGREADSGRLAVGMRADLVVLEADPLADIRNVRRIGGVMARGHWLPMAELERLSALAYR